MGITGLLPLLQKATKRSHVRKLSGCTVAIDAYCWLHKGAFGCAEKLGKGEHTVAYITYCMKYIQVLLDHNVKPIVVLDGRNLPSKEHTEKKRREKRDENRKLARKYLQEGKRKEAWECFTRCVDITPAMAREFIKTLRAAKIDYVVAPYEADSQLAYLAKMGIADVIITEDSDLVLFGCPKVFFKMKEDGSGMLFEASKIPQCLGLTPKSFRFEHFRWMCILSGCDYLPSIPGVGLGRAKKVILALEQDHDDIKKMIKSIPSILTNVTIEIPEDYIDGFIQAENTFLYQLVFDTTSCQLIPLNPYPDGMGPEDFPYAGSYEHEELALQLALGNADLRSLKIVDNFDPMKSDFYKSKSSIWSSTFEKMGFVEPKAQEEKKVAMEFSLSQKSPLKKKRPLAVVKSENDDNLDDDELMNIYGEVSSPSVAESSRTKDSPDPLPDTKRRRLTDEKTENENDAQPSSPLRTRSQSRVVPFRKSQEKLSVHVKSKYFRSETAPSKSFKTDNDSNNISSPGTQSEEEVSEENHQNSNLTIYSYETPSQESDYSDISASSQQVFMESQKSNISSDENTFNKKSDAGDAAESETVEISKSEFPKVLLTRVDVKIPEEITLDDDDEAYDSSQSQKLSLVSGSSGGSYTSSPYFSNSLNESKRTTRSSAPSRSKTLTPSHRVGLSRRALSRSSKKSPNQPTVKDMFVRLQKLS